MPERPRLLLVEDDPSNRLTLTALLEEEGFTVDEADSCASARAWLERGASYAAVILDGHLPDGRGPELVPGIRARYPSARVVLLSGAGGGPEQELVDRAILKGSGFAGVLDALLA